jgi:predicted O-methyltransferase YrrM
MFNKIKILLKNPSFLVEYKTRKQRLKNFLNITDEEIDQYFHESEKFWHEINEKQDKANAYERMSLERLQILYSCIRALSPNIMVETGVAGGSTSYFILSAMKKNGKGKLFSIDVDNPIWHDHKEYEVGWLVPDELRKNWILKIGDSKTELKPLLESLESVDIFFHDSDHSYSHMLFEFETIFSFLNSDKIILSDDINLNSSIDDFSKQKNLKLEKFFGFGVIRSHND